MSTLRSRDNRVTDVDNMASTGKDESDPTKNYRYLYGRGSEEKVKYEIPQLLLEDKISSVRKLLCRNWKKVQVLLAMVSTNNNNKGAIFCLD